MQTLAVLTSLQEQGIEDVYIELLVDIYRGVRQGDTISPKLFTAVTRGFKMDGEYLSHLHFADGILIYALIHHMDYNKCYRN